MSVWIWLRKLQCNFQQRNIILLKVVILYHYSGNSCTFKMQISKVRVMWKQNVLFSFLLFCFSMALFVPVLCLLFFWRPRWSHCIVEGPSNWEQPWQIKFTCKYFLLPIFLFLFLFVFCQSVCLFFRGWGWCRVGWEGG